ncbi:predicted protein [Naegleria gruberi]|uniref:inorganic diphosphatase n=1 Tax=Naegleria gruberi TaxID=5762 RepID=D2W521_NAEGR|nr:uncharacterized protein NAEGRDRAFT_76509 [Naegleria gruberi]EFC35833.1 predicted protein [Naegleria gruberi]|eukprot:XP_002668577.1 predicted protein [Naegleria gruberi strain NEG-M]
MASQICSQMGKLSIAKVLEGTLGNHGFKIMYRSINKNTFISPWHDIPLQASANHYYFVNEIPMHTLKKMEVNTKEQFNPIIQDEKKGKLREFTYRLDAGGIPFNYGMLPQTWEDPKKLIHVPFGQVKDGVYQPTVAVQGDNDPIDVVEISDVALEMGEVYKIKVFGILAMIDEGEMDWKVIGRVVSESETSTLQPDEDLQDIYDIPKGKINDIIDWFRMYKTTDGKPENHFGFNTTVLDKAYAKHIINQTHKHWSAMSK